MSDYGEAQRNGPLRSIYKTRVKAWLRGWLEINAILHRLVAEMRKAENRLVEITHLMQSEIKELRAEVTRLSIAQYVPPQQEEPKPKIIKTRNMREYTAILEREQEKEFQDAAG